VGNLNVRLFGPFQVTLDGEPVTGFHSDKVRALLAYLCTETAGPHRREKLAGLLWPDLPESSARSNLRRALANLRSVISDREVAPPFLSITPQTLAFDTASDAWVDVAAFSDMVGDGGQGPDWDISALERAVALYRGEFLEGFSLPDSPLFGEWTLLHRERWHRLSLEALQRLVQHFQQVGEYERGLGYAWRQVELDPWREEAQRQLMLLLALDGQRSAALAQYRTCRQLLADELGVQPGAETRWLYEQIRDGQVEPRPRPPAFLTEEEERGEPPVFVGREQALRKLTGFLDRARADLGQMAFVTGGPGRGKSALLAEFARRAMAAQPDLLVVDGKCNAYFGIGDAYLPFREVMAMLAGDVEARWTAGAISGDQARRLWAALPLFLQALVERGPHLIGPLVAEAGLLSRAMAAAVPPTTPWLQRLKTRVEHQAIRPESLDQSRLFEQVDRVLGRLAEHHPLLLILDDLHWADAASAGLLFHLSRRLEGRRILIACAYRPEVVSSGWVEMGRPAGRDKHPLGRMLAEFKRRFDNAWIDLTWADQVEGRAFVDAYVDSEPNRLGERFRSALFQRTAGHPLFTVEILRTMQEEGRLVRDSDAYWIEGSEPDWESLPTQVEGVIEQRIDHLPSRLQAILSVASVEGEEFTAQAVARVQGIEERQVLHALAHDLGRQHRLVRASEEIQIGQDHLSRYRFGHALFRDYIYGGLSPGERRLLHCEVGTALEGLYGEQVVEIAARLAIHFAGDPEKERRYARLAGERALAQYANKEAVRHLSHALALTPEEELAERYELLLAREQVYDRQVDRDAQRKDLLALETMAETVGEPRKQAAVAIRRAKFLDRTGDFPAAIAAARRAVGYLQTRGAPALEAQAYRWWGVALTHEGDFASSRLRLEKGLALARSTGSRWLEAEILRMLSWVFSFTGDQGQALASVEASLSIFQEIGDRHDELRPRHNLAAFSLNRFEYQRAREHCEEALHLCREFGDRLFEAATGLDLAAVLEACGEYATARSTYESLLPTVRSLGRHGLGIEALTGIACTSLALHESEKALPYVQKALALTREIGSRFDEAYALAVLGHILAALGQRAEANAAYKGALELRHELGQQHQAMEAVAGLARVALASDDLVQAGSYVEEILSHLESRTLEGTKQPLLVYLTCYRVLQANTDPRATAVLEDAHRLLHEIADKMTDGEMRQAYLTKVAAHREILSEHQVLCGTR
jgi:DNA-binding SARP family transcriptional activator